MADLFGLISGITTWLFGFGGGFVTVPLLYTLILTLWAGDSLAGEHAMQIAVATSALIMLFSAIITTLKHHKAKKIDWKLIMILFWGLHSVGSSVPYLPHPSKVNGSDGFLLAIYSLLS